jgi:anti-sigma-K factor RskA
MMERNQRIEEELFPFYALDALTDEERAEVDDYVAGNREAAARLAAMMPAAADLVAATTPVAPSPAVKAGLMARVEADLAADAGAAVPAAPLAPRPVRPAARVQSAPRRSWWDRLAPAVAALALVAFLASAAAAVRLSRQVSDLRGQIAALEAGDETLRAEVGALQTENETLRRELAARDDLLAQYIRPGAVTVAIGDATGDHPTAAGTLTTDPATGSATLRVANLPPLDPGTTYQAWVIVGETPLSAGTFAVDANGAGTHVFSGDLPADFDAIGVSLEPEGGSPAPTPGNIILLGSAF